MREQNNQQESDFREVKETQDDDPKPTPEELLGDSFLYFEFENNAIQELTDKTVRVQEVVEGEDGELEGPKSLPETDVEEEEDDEDEDEWDIEIERVVDSEKATADQDHSEELQVQEGGEIITEDTLTQDREQPQLEVEVAGHQADHWGEKPEGQGQEQVGDQCHLGQDQTDDLVKAASDIRKLIGAGEAEDEDKPRLEITDDIRQKLEEMADALGLGEEPQEVLEWIVDEVYSTHKLWLVRPEQVDRIDGRIFVEGYNQEFVNLGEPAFFDTAKKLAESIRKQNLIAMLMYAGSGKWTVLYESPRDKMTRVLDAMRLKA